MVFDSAGKLEDHTDYYDPSPMFEDFPVMGKAVTFIRKLVAG